MSQKEKNKVFLIGILTVLYLRSCGRP